MQTILSLLFLTLSVTLSAQTKFTFRGTAMKSGKHALYVSPDRKTNVRTFTFSNVSEALRYAEQHNADDTLWTTIYISPSVYWLDNPDDPSIRRPEKGEGIPYAMKLNLDRLRLIGISGDPEDVVLAVNRGQTQGADGNYTMLHINGSNIEAEAITFGNYCNVDLEYKRNPKLNRKRRKDAIVQAQLVIVHGDNYSLRNCRFISRLNLCPFVGAPHTEFQDCYFECTDDALCGTGTYRNCSFTFFSNKPFYTTSREGARFYDCTIHTKSRGTQYLTKVSGPVIMERCHWTSEDPSLVIKWDKRPDPRNYCAMRECTLNGRPLDVPTPTEPLTRSLPAMPIQVQQDIVPGRWTMDCYKPSDTMAYDWQADNTRSSWGYAEGIDGAEGSWGLVQLQKGARLMLTPAKGIEPVTKQSCTVVMDPCKGPGQGFGSATGQYLDICIKFDTKTLTGYGIRFIRTPEYDRSVETYLVEYVNGTIKPISSPQRCDLFRKTCIVTLNADGTSLMAEIRRVSTALATDASGSSDAPASPMTLSATMEHPNTFAGFHLQHTGSTGASATVIKSIIIKP